MGEKRLKVMVGLCMVCLLGGLAASDPDREREREMQEMGVSQHQYDVVHGKSLLSTLRERALAKDNFVLHMKINELIYFMTQKPRSYSLVIYLHFLPKTITNSLRAFEAAGKMFKAAKTYLPRRINGELKYPIFLVTVDITNEDVKNHPQAMEILSVDPKVQSGMLISTPEEADLYTDIARLTVWRQPYYRAFIVQEGDLSTRTVLNTVHEKLGVGVNYFEEKHISFTTPLVTLVLILVLSFVYNKSLFIIGHPVCWTLIFFVVYYIASSAVFLTISKNFQTKIWNNQAKHHEYIKRDISDQLAWEAFGVAGLFVLVSLAILLIFIIDTRSKRWPWAVFKRVLVWICLALGLGAFYAFQEVSYIKMGNAFDWIYPPSWLGHGSLRNSQGHTI